MNIIFIAICASLFTLLGGVITLKYKDKLHIILGFAAGCILAISLFALMPEAIELAKENSQNMTFLYISFGFIGYLIFDRLFGSHNHEDDHDCDNFTHSGKFGVFALVIHSLIDGIVVGVVLQCNIAIAIIVIFAILAHKIADGVSIVGTVLGKHGGEKNAFKYLLISALAPVIGIMLSFFVTIPGGVLCIIIPIFAGVFLYLSTSDLLIEAYHHHSNIWTTIATIMGITFIFIAIQIAGQFA